MNPRQTAKAAATEKDAGREASSPRILCLDEQHRREQKR
jgi:hypothetical protein